MGNTKVLPSNSGVYNLCTTKSTAEILLSQLLKKDHLFKGSGCKNPGVLPEMVKEGETQSNRPTLLSENIDQMSLFCQNNPNNKTKTEKPLAEGFQQQIE